MGSNDLRPMDAGLSLGGIMPERLDRVAASVATTAVVWGPALNLINQMLAGVSLLLGILFLLWRWRQAVKKAKKEAMATGAAAVAVTLSQFASEDGDA